MPVGKTGDGALGLLAAGVSRSTPPAAGAGVETGAGIDAAGAGTTGFGMGVVGAVDDASEVDSRRQA